MPRKSPPQRSVTSEVQFENFLQRFEGHPWLQAEVVYALPSTLLEELKASAPNFFPGDELAFEAALSQLPATGISQGQLFSYPLLQHRHAPVVSDFASKQRAIGAKLNDLINEVFRDEGVSPGRLEQFAREERELQARLSQRARGYSGWLVTNLGYRVSLAHLRKTWEPTKDSPVRFPEIPQAAFNVPLNLYEDPNRERYAEFMTFYGTWGLQKLETWDLPLPIQAGMGSPTLAQPSPHGSSVGIWMFIPWYLLIDKDLKINDLVGRQATVWTSPAKQWLNPQARKKFGVDRYARMLETYLYVQLALRARYGLELNGHTAKVDLAFTRFWSKVKSNKDPNAVLDTETQRKLREKMDRDLRTCQTAISEVDE